MPKFIPRFEFPRYNIPIADFKGHQVKALRRLQKIKRQFHLVLELRDLRAPLSSRNVLLDQIIDKRFHERIVIYTKRDCFPSNSPYLEKVSQWHNELKEKFLMLDCRRRNETNRILRCINWYHELHRQKNQGLAPPLGFKVLVTGMPNVGKSTLINSIKGSTKVARTGPEAGVTRSTSELIKIGQNHNGVYLLDTPGVGLPARLSDSNRMLALAISGCIKRNLVDPYIQADYLLYLMNLQLPRNSNNSLELLNIYPGALEKPTNDIHVVLNRLRYHSRESDTTVALRWLAKPRSGLIFDPELLLPCADFSMLQHVKNQLTKARINSFSSLSKSPNKLMFNNHNKI